MNDLQPGTANLQSMLAALTCTVVLMLPSVSAGAEVPYRTCFRAAALSHGINEQLLWAIARVESGYDPTAKHVNANHTTDFGVMQVNSSHLPWLHSLGITERHLIAQPCTNISVGASILADMVRRFGMTWRAVGAYGAGSGADRDQIRGVYAARVRTALLGLQGRNRQAAAHAAAAPGPTVAESPSSTQPQLQVLE